MVTALIIDDQEPYTINSVPLWNMPRNRIASMFVMQ